VFNYEACSHSRNQVPHADPNDVCIISALWETFLSASGDVVENPAAYWKREIPFYSALRASWQREAMIIRGVPSRDKNSIKIPELISLLSEYANAGR